MIKATSFLKPGMGHPLVVIRSLRCQRTSSPRKRMVKFRLGWFGEQPNPLWRARGWRTITSPGAQPKAGTCREGLGWLAVFRSSSVSRCDPATMWMPLL